MPEFRCELRGHASPRARRLAALAVARDAGRPVSRPLMMDRLTVGSKAVFRGRFASRAAAVLVMAALGHSEMAFCAKLLVVLRGGAGRCSRLSSRLSRSSASSLPTSSLRHRVQASRSTEAISAGQHAVASRPVKTSSRRHPCLPICKLFGQRSTLAFQAGHNAAAIVGIVAASVGSSSKTESPSLRYANKRLSIQPAARNN
jgi:hypothetical protein